MLPGLFQAIVWVTSGILIAIGGGLVWRDYARRRRLAAIALVRPDLPSAEPTVVEGLADVIISPVNYGLDGPATSTATPKRPVRAGEGLADLDRAISRITDEVDDEIDGPELARDPALPRTWQAIEGNLMIAISRINASLKRIGLEIAAPGEPGWRFGNRGYGVYRRIYMSGESIAWMRFDVGHDRKAYCRVRAHKSELAMLNNTVDASTVRLTDTAATDFVSRAVKSVAEYAAWIVPKQRAERQYSDDSWGEVATLVTDALAATHGALAPVGAALIPAGPAAWDVEHGRHRLVAHVTANQRSVARMHVERIGDDIEIAVGVPDARLLDLGRRRRVPIAGLTTLSLAEIMASCAWPAIAEAQAQRVSA
jgi:hypothetical protein